jgi:hypothetical protein
VKEPRNVEVGDRGPDVLAYKLTLRQLGLLDQRKQITNRFGDEMRHGVIQFQRANGLAATGKVNRVTFKALEPHFTEYSLHLVEKYRDAHTRRTFVLPIAHHEPARPGQFSVGHMDPVRVVLHDTESHDATGISDLVGVIEFWKRTPYPSGSLNGAHYLVDRDGFIAQVGTLSDILQHTGGANTGSVGVEQIGFASFTTAAWLLRRAQLDAVAKILAYLNHVHGIPLARSTSSGVSTHAMQSAIHPESMGHSDPGRGYPFGRELKAAKAYVAAGGWVDRH